MARQEQLAVEILGLISSLNRTLDSYLSVQSGRALDASSKQVNATAVEWMQDALSDLSATVAGIEVAFMTYDPGSVET
jgi:hypothetical protein